MSRDEILQLLDRLRRAARGEAWHDPGRARLCRDLRHLGPGARQGLSGARAAGAAEEGCRLDRQQSDDVAVRADLGHALRHRRGFHDRARPRGRGARRFRRRVGDRAFLPGRHLQYRRQPVGMLPAGFPAPRRQGTRRRGEPAGSWRLSSRNSSTPAFPTARATPMRSAPSAARTASARPSPPRCAPPGWFPTRFSPNTARASSR